MAVPTSGTLSMQKMAREAKHADYNGTQNMGTISMYDMMNGGQANGSTVSYPTLNTNCTPNPVGTLSNPTEVTIISWPSFNNNDGGTYPNTIFNAYYTGTAGNGTVFYANPCGTQTIDGISASVGDRVLVKNQTTQANNGIYFVASGSWKPESMTRTCIDFFFTSVATTCDQDP